VRTLLALLVLAAPVAAPAAADSEQAVSLGLGFASFSAPGEPAMNMAPTTTSPDWGSGLFASYERMIGTDVGLRIDAAGTLFRGGNTEKQTTTSRAFLGDAGLVFRFDILNVVPYAFAGLGVVHSTGGPIDRGVDYLVQIGGGVDWLRSRQRSYGLEIRLASFADDVTFFTVGLRATQRWGFF
jgi:opacity protein-like surface antigen